MVRPDQAMPPTYSTGWIYVLKNDAMPDLFKIGHTKKTVEERVAELSAPTSIPRPFMCIYRGNVRNPGAVEGLAHRLLAPHRVTDDREFFRVDFNKAVANIRRAASEAGERLDDEWLHPMFAIPPVTPSVDPVRSLQTPEVAVDPASRWRTSWRHPPLAHNEHRKLAHSAETTQLTPEIVRKGSASAAVEWVPLKGHRNER